MAIESYTQEEKDALITEFKLSGKNLFTFYIENKKTGKLPLLTTLREWINSSIPGVSTTTTLYQEFAQNFLPEDIDKQYIAFLEAKVTILESRIAELEGKK